MSACTKASGAHTALSLQPKNTGVDSYKKHFNEVDSSVETHPPCIPTILTISLPVPTPILSSVIYPKIKPICALLALHYTVTLASKVMPHNIHTLLEYGCLTTSWW
jgi:hypothetical protein